MVAARKREGVSQPLPPALNCCPPCPHSPPAAAPDTSTSEGKLALLRYYKTALAEWKDLLQRFLKSEDDQVGTGWAGGRDGGRRLSC